MCVATSVAPDMANNTALHVAQKVVPVESRNAAQDHIHNEALSVATSNLNNEVQSVPQNVV